MRVVLEGEPKEIAALMRPTQERQMAEVKLSIDGKAIAESLLEANYDTPEEGKS